MNFIDVVELTDKQINTINSVDVVFFGAGVSLFEPTDLPSGQNFSRDLDQSILGEIRSRANKQENAFLTTIMEAMPFEVINESCPNKSALGELIADLYKKKIPNQLHLILADLLLDGKVSALITPNYDMSIEGVLESKDRGGKVKRVTKEDELPGSNHPKIYLKLHGSADNKDTLIFSLNQESRLPEWLSLYLHELIHQKSILIIGYSGRDFDICPELWAAKPQQVFWLFRRGEKLSSNAKMLGKSTNALGIRGELEELVTSVYETIKLTGKASSTIDISQLINMSFTKTERWFWGLKVINSMNFSALTIKEIRGFFHNRSPSTAFDAEILGQYASALASSGKYIKAASMHHKAAKLLFEIGLQDAGNSHLLGASDALRCAGKHLLAINRHVRVSRETATHHPLYAHVLRNKILLMQHLYKILFVLPFKFPATWLRGKVRNMIISATYSFREQGNWYALQQMSLWNEKFHLPKTTITYKHVETPEAIKGYEQLNFLMGKMMAFRHAITRGKLKKTARTAKLARQFIEQAESLGLHTEVWKLHYLFMKQLTEFKRQGDFSKFMKSFFDCEYTLSYRLIQLIVEN